MLKRRKSLTASKTATKTERAAPVSLEGNILSKIKPVAKIVKPMKIVVYGRSSTGKTTFASSFPGPLLLIDCNDKGTDSVTDVKALDVLPATTYEEVKQAYWMLESGKHPYKTVIIDTMSMLQEFIIRKVLEEANKGDEEAGGWGTMTKKEWGEVSTILKADISHFRDLSMNVVFVAQDRVSNSDDGAGDEGQIAPEVGPRLMPSVASYLNAAVDVIGNTFIREQVSVIKTGMKKTEKRKIQYCMRIGPHSSYITKVRKPKGIEVPRYIVDPTFQKLSELKQGE